MAAFSFPAMAQFSFQSVPLIDVIHTLENKTDYRFLYRESQVSDIKITLETNRNEFIQDLEAELTFYQIAIESDDQRRQIVLYRQKDSNTPTITISGQVVDGKSGERLPYATLFWKTGDKTNGVASNSSGVFNINTTVRSPDFTLKSSYLGYESNEITLDLRQGSSFEDVTIRLSPTSVKGQDIVITGFSYPSSSDSIYRNFINTGVLSPFGENNTTRALQSLPSVSNGPAINNGITVRGSSPDATQILLDGITIYNQSHLFGLLDSFNPNALQTSGFFYDVTPAQFPSSPGGTLSMLTKTGSMNQFKGSGGLSNTAFNATVEGPLRAGNSSFLFSGRTSTMNIVDWLGNKDLIAYGLNIDRPSEVMGDNLTDLQSRLVNPGEYDALFYDLHGKLYYESKYGGRLTFGAYYGADNVSQDAERLVRRFNPNNPLDRFSLQNVETLNKWGNFSSSISYKTPISSKLYSQTLTAVSIYNTEFKKDDFVYNRVDSGGTNVQVFTFPLENKSVFNEIKFDQSFDLSLPSGFWTFGASYQYFIGEYFEESFDRPAFLNEFESSLIDVYGQLDHTGWDILNLHIGSRLHYYTDISKVYFSPRIKLKILDDHPLSFGLGYSKNYQFTHRLSFYNVSSPDIWVVSTDQQPPTASDYYTAGMYIRMGSWGLLQVEGYYKSLDNARLFEINSQTLTNSFNALPWLYKNKGTSKGVEFMFRNQFGPITLTNSYTLSEATFNNPEILNGEEFYAQWDQTHSLTSSAEINITSNLTSFLSFNYASGTPNRLYFLRIESEERLSDYQRLDAGLEYSGSVGPTDIELKASVFNVLDRNNTWYRELNLVIDTSVPQNQRRLTSQPVDVYDLGFQPSFSAQVWF
ncbi:TonB-dependent receptor [Gracilimonas sp. Q87]|uniref:TonB-dependent receptor n=1 Tax=Gracilimonas sp. Q87 TaxID=3384766 RepID=UPI0039844EC4